MFKHLDIVRHKDLNHVRIVLDSKEVDGPNTLDVKYLRISVIDLAYVNERENYYEKLDNWEDIQ